MRRRSFVLGGMALLAGSRLGCAAPAGDADALPRLERPLFEAWRSRFVADDGGRVVDDANGGISHSEGQGYGMLLAAFADDRSTFDGLWAWTRRHLGVREDGLFAWRYDPKAAVPVADMNNASDGDMLIAWALAVGARRWKEVSYRLAGAATARALMRGAILATGDDRWLLPGVGGFSSKDRPDGPVVNLSYWVFPAFPSLVDLAPEYDWRTLADSGLALIEQARFGTRDLPIDWVSLAGPAPQPANGFRPVFGWNAVRVPLYLALADREWAGGRGLLAPFATLWPEGGIADPVVVSVLPDRSAEAFGSAGYRAVPAAVACALDGARYPEALRRFEPEPYYPSTLRLLTLSLARQRYPECF